MYKKGLMIIATACCEDKYLFSLSEHILNVLPIVELIVLVDENELSPVNVTVVQEPEDGSSKLMHVSAI